jgi:hypothetical protein
MLRAAEIADTNRNFRMAVDVAPVCPLPERDLPVARDYVAFLAKIAWLCVVQVGHFAPSDLLRALHPSGCIFA